MGTSAKRRASSRRACAALILHGLLAILMCFGAERVLGASGKKLIEFGWDEPGTAFLRTNLPQMALTPFDGCVFHADYHQHGGTNGSFTWQAWGSQAFSDADLAEAFADLKAIRFGRFHYNFLRFNTTPAKLDWFDDYSAVVANAGLAARLARAGHCPGILFDIEQYDGPLFNYRKQRDAANKSWEVYAAQAQRRGRQVMEAFQASYPNLMVFLTFGYSLPWAETAQGKRNLADCRYGLLAPFLDGMVQAAKGRTRLIDGYESAYGFKHLDQFVDARRSTWENLLPITADPDKYLSRFSLSFGLWMDRDWRTRGWDPTDFSRNYFSPQELTASVRAALQVADEFVWIYTETPRWWGSTDPKNAVPSAYAEALRQAR